MSAAAPGGELVARVVGAITRRPLLWSVALIIATAGAGWWGAGIEIRADMEALFPETSANVQRARKAREIVRSTSEVQVLIGGEDRAANRAAGAALAKAFARHEPLVASVEFERDIAFFEHNAALFVPLAELRRYHARVMHVIGDAVRAELSIDDELDLEDDDGVDSQAAAEASIPTEAEIRAEYGAQDYSAYYESPDGTVLAVKVFPSFKPADTVKTSELMALMADDIARVRAKDPRLTVTTEGDYSDLTAAVDQIRSDLNLATGLALGGIVLLLVGYFRRLRALLLVMLPLLVGLAFTVAFARASIGHLNMITAFIGAIVAGLGIDFVVHAASRADEELDAGKPLPEAMVAALQRLGRPMIAAALTTMATFASLSFFDFRGFSQFGLIGAGGVALCLVAVYVALPAFEVAVHRLLPRKPRQRRPPRSQPPARSRRLALATLVVFGVVVALAATQLGGVQFEADMRKMRSKTTKKTSELKKRYRKEVESRTASPALIITAGLAETETVHTWLQANLDTVEYLDEVLSIFTFVPTEQEAKLPLIAEMRRKIDLKVGILEGADRADAERLRTYLDARSTFGVADLPQWVRDKFTDSGGAMGRYVLLYAHGVKSNGPDVLKIQDAIGSFEIEGETYLSTATWYLNGDVYTIVRDEGPVAVLVASMVVLLLLIGDLRSVRGVTLAFVPLVVGFTIMLGILGWAEIPLNMFNIIVLPAIFGIAVDTSIHLVHRVAEGTPIGTVMRTTGAAALVSSATTAVGFLSLLAVSNPGIQTIGTVAVIGIGTCFLSCVGVIGAMVTLGFTLGPDPRSTEPSPRAKA